MQSPRRNPLVSVAFDREMTLRGAVSGEEPVSYEQAHALLREDPALCSVRCVTRVLKAERVAFEMKETQDARIPKERG